MNVKKVIGSAFLGYVIFAIMFLITQRYGYEIKGVIATAIIFGNLTIGIALFYI